MILAIGLYFTQLKAKTSNLEQNKTIKIILPDIKTDYSQIIPKIDYEDIALKLSDKDTKQKYDITFMPNITFDENKKIEKIEIKLETKF